jgi:hypothetical protein
LPSLHPKYACGICRGLIADEEQQRRNRIRNRRARAPEHVMTADIDPYDVEDLAEFRRV